MKTRLLPVLSLLLIGCTDSVMDPVSTNPDGEPDATLRSPDLPDTPFDYVSEMVPLFARDQASDEDNTPFSNPVTNDGATLGRVLFYDTELSANRTIACASCHLQENAFADPNQFSIGFDGGLTGRNAMSVANIRFYRNGNMFWDERAGSVEEQALMPIQDPVEMGLTLDELVARVDDAPYFDQLFERAFGTPEVTADRIASAIAQFERSMVTFNSRFDDARRADGAVGMDGPFSLFTAEENRGLDLFTSGRTQCSRCHRGPLVIGDQARNNGLDLATTDDQGVGGGRFKAPSLRNIELTAPYMHDGRFATLRDVIEFYDDGVQNHPNLDNRLRQGGGVRRLNLSNADIDALVAFLETLTDPGLAGAERFSDPFAD